MHARTHAHAEKTEGRHSWSRFSATVLLFVQYWSFLDQTMARQPRYTFRLWVQPANTNVKIIPLRTGLKYTHTHTQSRSLSQAPGTKTRAHTHTRVLAVAHAQKNSPTTEYILRRKKNKTKQNKKRSVIKFRAIHFRSRSDGAAPPQTGSGLYHVCVTPYQDGMLLFYFDDGLMLQWPHWHFG